jgi:hypothetical protein
VTWQIRNVLRYWLRRLYLARLPALSRVLVGCLTRDTTAVFCVEVVTWLEREEVVAGGRGHRPYGVKMTTDALHCLVAEQRC